MTRNDYRAVKVLVHQMQRDQTDADGDRAEQAQGTRIKFQCFAHHRLPTVRGSE